MYLIIDIFLHSKFTAAICIHISVRTTMQQE